MFESLQEGLTSALRSIAGKGKLTESNMRDGLKLVERAMLEADVSFSVVKAFVDEVSQRALGEEIIKSMRPDERLLTIVHEELIRLLGEPDPSLHLRGEVTVLMLCGLQGSGKTTTCGKLSQLVVENGRKPMLVAADLQRPAAVEQLRQIGNQLGVPVYSEPGKTDPVKVCQNAVNQAKKSKEADVVILDTAGRLHIDDELMQQLSRIDNRVSPDQVYLVVDGMTGQDAVNSAEAFNQALELNGVIMTKLDGDARGGAALSVRHVTGVPIKFIGVGEQFDALQVFDPQRIAGQILGQGDLMGLIEIGQKKLDQDELLRQQEKLERGEFTLDTFRNMLTQVTQLGPLEKVMRMIPGRPKVSEDSDKDMKRLGGLIDSMTPAERRNPKIIDQSRRRRIAAGAGVEPHEVSQLVKQFDGMAGAMQNLAGQKLRDQMGAIREMADLAADPAARPPRKQNSGQRLRSRRKNEQRKQREREQRRQIRKHRMTLELVVVGATFKESNREEIGGFRSYFVGARNKLGGYDVVGEVSEFNRARDDEIRARIESEGLMTKPSAETVGTLANPGVAQLRPAIVVEVAFKGITRDASTGMFNLRYPRISAVCTDRAARQAATNSAIEALRQQNI